MRSYPIDSKESMARVVVMALLADGAIDPSELRLLERPEILARMGFDQPCLTKVIQEFCEDMSAFGYHPRAGALGLDAETIDHLLNDIRSPVLQANLLRAMLDAVYADGHVTGGEAAVIAQAMTRWSLDLCEVRAEPLDRRWKFTARKQAVTEHAPS